MKAGMRFFDANGARMDKTPWQRRVKTIWKVPRSTLITFLMLAFALTTAAVTQINLASQVQGLLAIANGGTNTATFAAHRFFGNNTASTAAPAVSSIGTSDTSPNWYVAGAGTAQAQTATLSPAATALTPGLIVDWKPSNANTGSGTTLAVNGLTATTIVKVGGAALAANDLTTTAIASAIYDGTNFELQNPQTTTGGGSGTVSTCSTANSIGFYSSTGTTIGCTSEAAATQYTYVAGGGTAQAQTATLAPALAALATGVEIRWKPAAANTAAAPTLAVNGLTATAVTKCGTTALVANDLTTSFVADAVYDGTEFQLMNPQAVPCGAMSAGTGTGNFSDNETPTGSCPTTSLSLAHAPAPAASLNLFYNGQLLVSGGADYSLSSATVTLTNTCPSGTVFVASYRY